MRTVSSSSSSLTDDDVLTDDDDGFAREAGAPLVLVTTVINMAGYRHVTEKRLK